MASSTSIDSARSERDALKMRKADTWLGHRKHVPKFLADVRFKPYGSHHQHLEIRGILLEYVPGFNIDGLSEAEPNLPWQHIQDEAVRVINLIGDCGIIINAVAPRNILVRTGFGATITPEYEVVVIDFGHSVCRRKQSDAKWRHEKSWEDEEGSIGFALQDRLKRKLNVEVEYQPSFRWQCHCKSCVDPANAEYDEPK